MESKQSPNNISFELTKVNDIPHMIDAYAHKPISFVDDGVFITTKFHDGLYGDLVIQLDVHINLRVNSIVYDLENYKVLYRDHFNIFEDKKVEGVKHTTRTYIDHLKSKKIDQSKKYLCIYVKNGFFAEHKDIFTNNFHISLKQNDESLTITFSKILTDLEEEFNRNAFFNACKNNYIESIDTSINWKYPENHKFCVNCIKNDEHHTHYKERNNARQIGFCINWEDLLNNNINCPACSYGKIRDHKASLIMDILNEQDKKIMCNKILNFLETNFS
jgi:hypothetical protein